MAWRLLTAWPACSGTRYAAVHPQHAKHIVAPCGLSSAAGAAGQSRHAQLRSCGNALLSRATASGFRSAAHRWVPTTASTGSASSPAFSAQQSDKEQRMDVSTTAAPSATMPVQSADSIASVLAVCKGSGGPTETLDQLLELDEALEEGHAQSWASEEQPVKYVLAFRALAEFEPQNIKGSPELRHAAAAARRSLMHGAATAFVPYAPNAPLPIYLAAALLACAKVGYGWGSGGDATAEAEAEVPLAAVVLKRLGELADAPGGLRNLEYGSYLSSIGHHVVPYRKWDVHACLWEAMAAAPPAVAAAHARLLDASAHTVVGRGFREGCIKHPMLKALAQLHPLVREAGPLGRILIDSVPLYDEDLSDQELCEAVEAVGELLLNAPAVRRALMATDGDMPGILRMLVTESKRRLKKSVRRRAGADAAAQRSMAAWWPARPVSNMEAQDLLRLLRGLTMISEACSAEAASNPGSSSSSSSTSSSGGGWGEDDSECEYYEEYDSDYEDELYYFELPQEVASQAAVAAQYVASALEGGALWSLSPQGLSYLSVWLARTGYGTSDSYRNLVAAATARWTFRSAATPADWAQLWHAMALVRHRPDDALVRCTTAAMTTQQQYDSATAEDCSTLLLSLAELRCYDGGLVEGLLGRLVQLVVGGGGVEVRDLANAVWAVAVMGPEALRSHCGAVGQLLREVVVSWEQGRVGVGVGSQEQLRQLWVVQLELEGLVDGDAGSSVDSSGPGQLRGVLPPDLLRAAEEAAGEGPGGVHSSSRRLQRLRDEVCSVLQGMVQQGGGQQGGGQQRAGGKKAQGSGAGSHTAAEGDSVAAGVAAGLVPSCTILSVTPEVAVPELRCTADVVVELGGGRRVAVEVEGLGQLLTNHPHTETRTGPAELRRRQLERVLGSGNVVGVSYWAWEELGGDRGRQEAWLCGRLAEGPGAGDEESGGEAKGHTIT